jgi:hypothetical protein
VITNFLLAHPWIVLVAFGVLGLMIVVLVVAVVVLRRAVDQHDGELLALDKDLTKVEKSITDHTKTIATVMKRQGEVQTLVAAVTKPQGAVRPPVPQTRVLPPVPEPKGRHHAPETTSYEAWLA